jgi:hypothetical protein
MSLFSSLISSIQAVTSSGVRSKNWLRGAWESLPNNLGLPHKYHGRYMRARSSGTPLLGQYKRGGDYSGPAFFAVFLQTTNCSTLLILNVTLQLLSPKLNRLSIINFWLRILISNRNVDQTQPDSHLPSDLTHLILNPHCCRRYDILLLHLIIQN